MDGLLVIDKPRGITSHDVVRRVRRALRTRKVGHAGTLDPLASGVLLVAAGEGTRILQFLADGDKTYRATLKLGEITDTQDAEGQVLERHSADGITEEAALAACDAFRGEILQVPPMFSALKRDGVPLYKLARKGMEVERQARGVTIHRLEVLKVDLPYLSFEVDCSKGTYVRTLCHDIGASLHCGAHLTALRRVRSGHFTIDRSIPLDELEKSADSGACPALLTPLEALCDYPALEVEPLALPRLLDGIPPEVCRIEGEIACEPGDTVLLVAEGSLRAVARYGPGRTLDDRGDFQLLRVFNRN